AGVDRADRMTDGLTQRISLIDGNVFGVRVERDFDDVTRRRSTKDVKHRREQGRDRVGGEKRRSATAEVEGVQTLATETPGLAPGVSRAYSPQFPEPGIHVRSRRDVLAHRDGEIAVGAAALAEGDMEVEVGHGES